MKILKFRIYDKTEKKMKFLDSIWNMPDPSYDFDEIQQFTGLFDKSGKEIYEGDIVKKYGAYGFTTEKIIYKIPHVQFMLEMIGEEMPFETGIYEGTNLEVIGNVWENGDLIDNK